MYSVCFRDIKEQLKSRWSSDVDSSGGQKGFWEKEKTTGSLKAWSWSFWGENKKHTERWEALRFPCSAWTSEDLWVCVCSQTVTLFQTDMKLVECQKIPQGVSFESDTQREAESEGGGGKGRRQRKLLCLKASPVVTHSYFPEENHSALIDPGFTTADPLTGMQETLVEICLIGRFMKYVVKTVLKYSLRY